MQHNTYMNVRNISLSCKIIIIIIYVQLWELFPLQTWTDNSSLISINDGRFGEIFF